jgi:monoamine oxidase
MATTPAWDVDVAIVGAGVAGAYVAWRLATAPLEQLSPALRALAESRAGGLRIGLYEYSHRIGGRLLSVDLPGIPGVKAELGGMRFINSHQRVVRLVQQFKLKTRPLRVADPNGRNMYYLRGEHFAESDWNRPSFSSPYKLDRGERARSPGNLLIEVALRHAGRLEVELDRYRNLGFWNLLMEEYSDQAYRLIRDAGGYESIVGNWSAADAIPFLLADFSPGLEYFALEEGFQQLPLRLAEEFQHRGGTVSLGCDLQRIDNVAVGDGTGMRLLFRQRDEQGEVHDSPLQHTARQVVLALPRRAIERLHSDSLLFDSPDVRDDLRSIISQAGFKIFTCYEHPWWRRTRGIVAGRSVTDLPIRQCYYWVTGRDGAGQNAWITGAEQTEWAGGSHSVLMASYNDGGSVEFWKGLSRQRAPYVPPPEVAPPGVAIPLDSVADLAPAALVEQVQLQLRELHGLSRVESPRTAEIIPPYFAVWRDWTEEPYGGGWHFWKIGVDSQRIIGRVQKPYANMPLYICGEAWSRQQGWVEGALESADEVLSGHLLN